MSRPYHSNNTGSHIAFCEIQIFCTGGQRFGIEVGSGGRALNKITSCDKSEGIILNIVELNVCQHLWLYAEFY
jgi:hypothetical protein